jgi:branched-chain amino acid transport system substrate-binding protein
MLAYVPPPAAAEVVKLGATLAVTGPFSAEAGPNMLKFMEAWEQVVNEEGGVRLRESGPQQQLDLIVYDDESKPEKSVELYEKLANVDQVHAFIGPFSSPITKAASAVAERLNIPMVACEANDTSLFTRGFQWFTSVLELGRPWSRTYFEMLADANKQGATSYRTVAIVSSDTPHTRDVGRGAVDFARQAGLQVIAEKQVPFRTTDFSGVIPGLKVGNPDIVFLALWPPEMFAFVKQADELGLRPKELYSRFLGAAFGQAVGEKLAEGVVGGSYSAQKWFAGKRVEKALERAGLKPYEMNWTAIKITCLEAMLQAIQDAGTVERSTIMATLRGYSTARPIKALYGPLYFNFNVAVDGETANGFGTQFPIVMQIQGGKQVVVWPRDIQDAPYRSIPWLGR